MKFTDEEAFEKLKGILTNNSKKPLRMSEKSVKKQLEILMPLVANEEMELSDFVDKVKDTFSVMNSNAEKDNADFVKQWEKNHPTPTVPPNPDNKPDEPDAQMVALQKRLEELEAKETAREKERAVSQKRSDLLKAMKEKGIKDEQWAKDFIAEIAITDDFDIDSKAEAYLKIYNKSQASTTTTTTPGSSTGDGNQPKDLLADAKKVMRQRRDARERLTINNQENGK